MIALFALAACTITTPIKVDEDAVVEVGAEALWAGGLDPTEWVVLRDVVVTSPRAGETFYVQGRGGGPRSGVRIDLTDGLNNWPPPIGTPIDVYGPVSLLEGGPVMTLHDHGNAASVGEAEEPTAVPWSDDPELLFALVVAEDLRVTSDVDPVGRADSTGPALGARFGVDPPGFNRSGDAVGVIDDGYVSLRQPGDWSGDFTGDPPVEATIGEIRAGVFAEGTPVAITDVVQVAPWSRGGQWTAVQDGSGDGLWVDAEAWGIAGARDELGSWLGEVRTDDEGPRLRVWVDPDVTGSGAAIEGGQDDGDVVRTTLTGLSGPDAYGEWSTADWIVDDRFLDLDQLEENPAVLGVVRGLVDARLAVIETASQ